jgi:hypothetical protein
VRPRYPLAVFLLTLAAICVHPEGYSQVTSPDRSQAAQPPVSPTSRRQSATAHDSHPQDEGARIFQQNCSRCHWAPDGFSSHISGTIVRHMRVRASLSQHDAEALLRFLNP